METTLNEVPLLSKLSLYFFEIIFFIPSEVRGLVTIHLDRAGAGKLLWSMAIFDEIRFKKVSVFQVF